MTIRDREAHGDSATDWGSLSGVLKPGTSIIDIDGAHDCNGRVLIIEAKPSGFKWTNVGQWSLLRALARSCSTDGSFFLVLVVYLDDAKDPRTVSAVHVVSRDLAPAVAMKAAPEPCNFSELCAYIGSWTDTDEAVAHSRRLRRTASV